MYGSAVTAFILERIPQFSVAVDELGRDFVDSSAYLAVAAMYDFAVGEFALGHMDVVRRVLAAVEEALGSGVEDVVAPFSIDFIEALSVQSSAPHYEAFCRELGPLSRKHLEQKCD
jgi:hypothetical protein